MSKSRAGVFVCGSGETGQLGLGPDVLETEKFKRLDYFDNLDVVSVYAGGLHNMVLTRDGKVYSFGCNDERSLGRDGEETLPEVIDALGGKKIVKVSCGDSHTLFLDENGTVHICGTFRDAAGAFGMRVDGSLEPVPVAVPNLSHVTDVTSGANHCGAVTSNETVLTWGVGEQGQLGRMARGRNARQAALIARPANFRPPGRLKRKFCEVFAGGFTTFFLHEDRKHLFAVGLNNFGQCGIGAASQGQDTLLMEPTRVVGLPEDVNVVDVRGGEHHTVFLLADGTVYSCGRGEYTGLSESPPENVPVPQRVPNLPSNVTAISAGSCFSIALTSDERDNLWSWGRNENGQLARGDQDFDDMELPEKINIKGRRAISASAGGQHLIVYLSSS